MSTETLAPDVAWEPSGHLSEVALSAFADGEDALFDAAMHAHLASCEACAVELGNVAMRAAQVNVALLDPSAAAAVRDVRQAMTQAAEAAPSVSLVLANEAAPSIDFDAVPSLSNDVGQSLPSDVRQSLPSAVAQSLPIGVAPWAPPASVRASSPDLVKARRKVPVGVLFPALTLAMIAAVPSLLHVPAEVAQTWTVLREVLPSFLRIAPQALAKAWSGPRGMTVVLMVWMLAATLVVAGLRIAKRQSKKLLVDGGRR